MSNDFAEFLKMKHKKTNKLLQEEFNFKKELSFPTFTHLIAELAPLDTDAKEFNLSFHKRGRKKIGFMIETI